MKRQINNQYNNDDKNSRSTIDTFCRRVEETSAHHNKRIPVDLSTYHARVMRFCPNEIDLPQTYRGLLAINPAAVRASDDFSFPPRRESDPRTRGVQLSTGHRLRVQYRRGFRGVIQDDGSSVARYTNEGWTTMAVASACARKKRGLTPYRTAVDLKKKSTLAGIYCE